LTDTGGNPVADGTYNLTFKLYKSASMVWEESHSNVPVEAGVFSVVLGGSTPLDTVAFNQPIELGVTVEGDSEIVPRVNLTSTAFALGMRGMYAVEAQNGSRVSRNVIGGASNNYVAPGSVGATISGGGGQSGTLNYADSVLSHWGTISGGAENVADEFAAVGGGQFNLARGSWTTVAGGRSNRTRDSYGTVGGGFGNRATGNLATIPGGSVNAARGEYSFAAGLSARANHDNSFVWNGPASSVDSLVSTGTGQFLIGAPGGVGVNTNTPATSLHVASSDLGLSAANLNNDDLVIEGSDAVLGLYSTSGGSWGSAISLAELATVVNAGVLVNKWTLARYTSSANNHLVLTYGSNLDYSQNEDLVRFETDGDVFIDGNLTPGGADLAEAVATEGAAERYAPGDVMVVSTSSDRTFAKSSEPYSTRVAGVYATKPGVLLRTAEMPDDLSEFMPLAVVGIVPTRVSAENGAIRRGDLLVTSSTDGHAMRANPEQLGFGMALGKALEDFDGPGSGLIEVLVSVR
jgi:hypothetical protein